MLFNSLPFIFVFLPIVLAGFQLLGRLGKTTTMAWLAAASLAFYSYWNRTFLLLLLSSIVFNFACAHVISRTGKNPPLQRALLWGGIAGNLTLLCYYKYWFPLLNSFGALAHPQKYFGNVILPLGISFFTLTQVAYLVDLQQGEASALGFLEHLFFVSFFPHLIAGPILHHREFMPQVTKARTFRLDSSDVAVGATWFVMGLFKKVVIADQIAARADFLFANPDGQPLLRVWCGVLSYALQLYFDFSGYSDMAIGLARMFSLRFPLNFNSPYKATSIIEFWQRWHMTLTSFLMLYIYNPLALAVNRRRLAAGKAIGRRAVLTTEGFLRIIALPTLVTMLIAGIWHGAGRTFLAFGLLHGFFICVNHACRTFAPKLSAWFAAERVGRTASVAITLLAVLSAQIFFRADSIEDALGVIRGAAGLGGLGLASLATADLFTWVVLAILFVVVWWSPNTQEILGEYVREDGLETGTTPSFLRWQPTWASSLLIGAAFFACFVLMKSASRFLYFQF